MKNLDILRITEEVESENSEETRLAETYVGDFAEDHRQTDTGATSLKEIVVETYGRVNEFRKALNERYDEMNRRIDIDQRYLEAQVESREKQLAELEDRFRSEDCENLEELLEELEQLVARPFASIEAADDSFKKGEENGL